MAVIDKIPVYRFGSQERMDEMERKREEPGNDLMRFNNLSPIPSLSNSPSISASSGSDSVTASDHDTHQVTRDGCHNGLLGYTRNTCADKSGYTKNNTSKDELDHELDQEPDPTNCGAGSTSDGQSCSCSVSLRSSSPESVLSVSGSASGWTSTWPINLNPIEQPMQPNENAFHLEPIKKQFKAPCFISSLTSATDLQLILSPSRPSQQQDQHKSNAINLQTSSRASQQDNTILQGKQRTIRSDEKQNSRTREETPIEREIRTVREREEELRREKGMDRTMDLERKSGQKKAVRSDQKISSQPTPQKSAPILSHISAVAEDTQTIPYNDTQRKLATTRLQQEIEEQKRREMELRRDGRVRSISDEHINPTDSPSPENGEPAHQETLQSQDNQSISSEEERQFSFSSESSVCHTDVRTAAVQSPESDAPRATIKEQRAFFEQASGKKTSAGLNSLGINRFSGGGTAILANGPAVTHRQKVKPEPCRNIPLSSSNDDDKLSIRSPSRSESVSSLLILDSPDTSSSPISAHSPSPHNHFINPKPIPPVLSPSSDKPKSVNVCSMKVPASVKRLMTNGNRPFSAIFADGESNLYKDFSKKEVYVDYSAVRATVPPESLATKSQFRTTEKKISDELREMEMREEELRNIRVNLGVLPPSTDLSDVPENGVLRKNDGDVHQSRETLAFPLHSRTSSMVSLLSESANNNRGNGYTRNQTDTDSGSSNGILREGTKEEKPTKPLRRLSLVAQWEERIQQQA